jgi:hypothetical protein
MKKVKKDDNTGCWLWQGGIHNGYGNFVPVGGKSGLAHRTSYRLFKGIIPDGLLVLHSCNIPACVNPDHLRVGTNADNAIDKMIYNRCNPRKGSDCHYSKLTNEKIFKIRNLRDQGLSYKKISELFGVTFGCIAHIINRKSWKHI